MLTKQKYKKQMARILTALLVVAVGIGFVPQMDVPAYADDGSAAIQLVTGGAAPNIKGAQANEGRVWDTDPAGATIGRDTTFTYTSTATPPSGKQDIDLDVIVHDAVYPDEIVCIVSSNADGEYALTIANVQATITVKGGLGSYSAGHLESGNYQAKVIFEGNSNYNSGSSETTFSVSPQNAGTNFAVKADPAEVTEGDTVTIIPTLQEGVTGTVKYYLGTSTDGKLLGETSVGEKLELSTKNGNALLAGTHAITASYTGDDTHLPAVRTVLVAVNHAPADAEDEVPAIQLVQNGTAPNIPGGQGGSSEGGVWFGNYKQSSDGNGGFLVEPVKWRVLANADGKLFLLSDKCLDSQIYGPNDDEMTWETSTIRAWLNGLIFQGDSTFVDNNFIDSAFSDKEQAAIAMTSVKNKTTSEYNPNPLARIPVDGNDTEDQMFLLCAGESMNAAYGFTDDYEPTPTREAEATDYAADRLGNSIANFWWLRSRDDRYTSSSLLVYSTGAIGGLNQSTTLGVRPAFNLDLSSVLFTSAPSASDGGKVSGDVGALNEVGTNSTNEWKLTLQSGHDDFEITECTPTENGVSVKYKGAIAGTEDKPEYISAIITDKPVTDSTATIKYYGRIAKASDAAGTVTINTEGKLGDGDILYVFNEQCNGDKKTDYASAMQEVMIPELISYDVTFKVVNGAWNDGTTTEETVTLSRYDNEDKALVLQPEDIPEVGDKPDSGYKAGSWDVTPSEETVITGNTTYTYTYEPAPSHPSTSIDNAPVVLDDAPLVYTGQPVTPVIRTIGGKTLQEGRDYTVRYSQGDTLIEAPTDAGTYTMTITGRGNFAGSTSTEFTIGKADGTLSATGNKVKAKSKTVKLNKAKKISADKAYTIEGTIGELAFSKVKASKKAGKFKVNAKSGQIKVKKGLKKGRYKLTVLISDAGDNNHEAAEAQAIVKIRIKK